MKSILALVGGGERDAVILQTALAAARPLAAHVDFLHVHVPAAQAARHDGTAFARGAGLRNALEELDKDACSFAELAARNVRALCESAAVRLCDAPDGTAGLTACFREERSSELDRLTFHARHSDLLVIGRAKQTQGLAPDTLEHLILNSGRPILVAASSAPQKLTGTILVCWKECPTAARALAAAMPLLAKAERVVFASVAERSDTAAQEAVEDLAQRFAWSGVPVETQLVAADGRPQPAVLATLANDCGADLIVMGAYSHSRARSLIFGSCTEAFLEDSDRPILLMH